MDAEEARRLTEKLYRRLDSRRPEIDELDGYHDGKQPLVFASQSWREFHRGRYAGFSDNWCAVVANAPAERLRPIGIRLGTDAGATKDLWEDWQRNEGDLQVSQGLLEAVVARRSFVKVWGDRDDRPTVDFLHPSQALVDYDSTGLRSRRAIEAWVEDDVEYGVLHTPTAVWKWKRPAALNVKEQRTPSGVIVSGTAMRQVGQDSGWEPWEVADEPWPLPNPMGKVAIVELANRPRLGREPVSDIKGTKAMQDAINLLWAYLFGAADHASLPARVVTGQDRPKIPVLDDKGQKIGEKPVDIKDLQQGRMLWLTGKDAKISQWDAARLDVFTDVIAVAVGHIAAQTRTPAHYLITTSDNVPSTGYELAEGGLVSRVTEAQRFFSADLRRVFELIALAGGRSGLAEQMGTAEVLWANAAIRNESQLVDALQKRKTMGYPLEYLLEIEGKDPSEIERVMAMVARERSDPTMEQVARELSL
ncbi:phage portal protein [Oerskovia turbata]